MLFLRTVSVALACAIVALSALPARAAISFVQALGIAQANAGSTLSITLGPTTVAVGNTIVVSFAMNPRGEIGDVSCSDTRSNAWHVDGDVTRGSGIDGVRAVTCSARVTTALGTGDQITVSHPQNADERAMSASEFSGLRSDAGAMTARALRVKGLKSGKGEQTLTFHGTMTVPTTPEIDPVARGVRVLITTAAGDVVVDVTIPGGGGWKTNRVRTLWSYHGGAGGRIREVTMRRNRSAPGTIRFTVSGKGANLAPPDGTPIIATIVLDAPFATTGQCGEADFGSCKKSKSGKALVCS